MKKFWWVLVLILLIVFVVLMARTELSFDPRDMPFGNPFRYPRKRTELISFEKGNLVAVTPNATPTKRLLLRAL